MEFLNNMSDNKESIVLYKLVVYPKNTAMTTPSSIKIRPILNNVVVKPAPKQETTQGGVIIPESAQKVPNRGTVEAVGNKTDISVGDQVIYGQGDGTPVIVDDQLYLILRESQILAII
jgi:chaperonin GroES